MNCLDHLRPLRVLPMHRAHRLVVSWLYTMLHNIAQDIRMERLGDLQRTCHEGSWMRPNVHALVHCVHRAHPHWLGTNCSQLNANRRLLTIALAGFQLQRRGGGGLNTALWLEAPPPQNRAQLKPPKILPRLTPGPGSNPDPKFGKK